MMRWRWFFGGSAGLAVIAGLMLFVGAADTDRFFSWTIEPPLTAAFLGAAYWAAAVVFVWAARQSLWSRWSTVGLPQLVVVVLLLIATLLSLDKFHHDLYGRFWVVVYVLIPIVLLYLVATELRSPRTQQTRGPTYPGWLRGLLALQAAVYIVIGAGLFLAPGTFDDVWPWALTPLTARVTGAFLLDFGVAALMAVVGNDVERFRGAGYAYLALGLLELLAALLHGSDFDGTTGPAIYVAFCCVAVVVGAWASLAGRSGPLAEARAPAP